jgi:hypothetical protein
MRLISWGGKFLADALLLEQRLTRQVEIDCDTKSKNSEADSEFKPEASQCAS